MNRRHSHRASLTLEEELFSIISFFVSSPSLQSPSTSSSRKSSRNSRSHARKPTPSSSSLSKSPAISVHLDSDLASSCSSLKNRPFRWKKAFNGWLKDTTNYVHPTPPNSPKANCTACKPRIENPATPRINNTTAIKWLWCCWSSELPDFQS